MPSIRNVIRQSVLADEIPKKSAARRAELASIRNPLKRGVALGVHNLAVQHPSRVAPYVGLGSSLPGVELIGAGYDSLVYRQGDGVIKVHKKSIGAPPEKQDRILARKREEFLAMYDLLADFMLPQFTEIAQHPLYSEVPVVLTRQAFQPEITDAKLFRRDNHVNQQSFSALHVAAGSLERLQQLITSSRALVRGENLIPDFCGRSNLIVTGDSSQLTLIDGQPLTSTLQGGQRAGLRLMNLELAVEAVT